jgi:hypothetical protein
MFRSILIVVASLSSGCTVAWLDLRAESMAEAAWECPAVVAVNVTSGYTTNTFGPKEQKPERVQELENRYRTLAEQTLHERKCKLKAGASGETLTVQIEEMHQLSALPQEWLTGLSLGLIPSWGTRPAEVRFSFSQGSRRAAYVVDDKRVNHLVLFPVFWLSFFLVDNDREFKNALEDFTAGL